MPNVTMSNLTIVETNALPNYGAYRNSVLSVSFDIAWSDFLSGNTNGFGAYFELHAGTNHSEVINVLHSVDMIYSSTALSGTARVTGTINVSDLGIGSNFGNYFFTVYAEHRTISGGYGTWGSPSYWDFTLLPYPLPAISSFSISRCNASGVTDDSGANGKISIAFSVYSVGNTNTKQLIIKYKKTSESTWSQETVNIASLGYTGSLSGQLLSATFAQDSTHDIRAELTDAYATTVNTKSLSPAYALMHMSADKTQIGFGKYCEAGGPKIDFNTIPCFRGAGNQSVTQQTGFATDTYLTGSRISLPSAPLVGTTYRLIFDVTKTAAGTATPIITIRTGTAGTVSDAARCTFTFGAGTTAADTGIFEVICTFRTVGSGTSAIIQGVARLTSNLTTTGLSNAIKARVAVSSGFDSTTANLGIGASYNGGASAAHTIQLVRAELLM